MKSPAVLEVDPKAAHAAAAPQFAESSFGRWSALTAALLGWLFDGFEMGLFPLIGGPALAELLGPAAATDATQMVRRDHRRVSRRRRDRRRVFRLARRSHRARSRDVAQHFHLRRVHRPVRIRDRGVAHRGAAFRRVARHGRRMVARRGARQRDLAEQITRADRRADWRRGKSGIPDGRPAEHRAAQLHREHSGAAARSRDARLGRQ